MLLDIFQQGLDPYNLFISVLSVLLVAITAFAYHEFAHAFVADYLGDPTPRENGRMTFNPLPHLDMMGMILLLFIGFGWATTPVRPDLLRGDPRRSMALVAVAGPMANLFMAILFSIPWQLIKFGLLDADMFFASDFAFFFWVGLNINILLLVFNLLPVPPLDGFTILIGLLPDPLAAPLIAIRRSPISLYLLLGVLFILPRVTGFGIGNLISPIVERVLGLLIS
ncbi:MAG: Zn-dependent protease [Cellvibrionaceae bacterium]|jgi:Zn-dependent protease